MRTVWTFNEYDKLKYNILVVLNNGNGTRIELICIVSFVLLKDCVTIEYKSENGEFGFINTDVICSINYKKVK